VSVIELRDINPDDKELICQWGNLSEAGMYVTKELKLVCYV